jgi:O-antigen ligase
VFGIGACGVAMLLGLARGAWLGCALAFLALMILPKPPGRRIHGVERVGFTLMLVALLGLGASYLVESSGDVSAFQGITEKAANLVNLGTGTGLARLGETQTAITDWKKSPMFGLGSGSYDQRHPQKVRTNYIGNLYLRALYETGLVGVLLLVAFLLLLFWPNRALLFSSSDLAPVARALTFGGAVLTVAYAATDSTLLMWPWILFALVRGARSMLDREYQAARPPAPSRPSTAVPPVEGNGHGGVPAPVPVRALRF